MSAETLRNWVSRKPQIIFLDTDKGDRPSGVRGSPNRYSFVRVMQVAITAALVRSGWDARNAALAAVAFTDKNTLSVGPDGEPIEKRTVGELFPKGETFLIAYPHAPMQAQLANFDFDMAWSEISHALEEAARLAGSPLAPASVLNINALANSVRLALEAKD